MTTEHLTGDAIDKIEQLINAASKPTTFSLPDNRGTCVVDKDGNINEKHNPPRKYKAESIDGVVAMVSDLAALGKIERVRVFVSSESVYVVLSEDKDRTDRISLPLSMTPGFQLLNAYTSRLQSLSQSELEWMLRSDFADSVSPENFLPAIRKLKFTSNAEGTSEIKHGSESMGAAVEKRVAGTTDDEIPEEIKLGTPVFEILAADSDFVNEDLRCAVRINVEEKTFTIKPIEGELVRAKKVAVDWITETLKNNLEAVPNVVVYRDSLAH